MPRKRLLLVTRSQTFASELESQLDDHSVFKVATKIVSNGHADPLQGLTTLPDILLLHCETSHGELQFLADTHGAKEIPLIVVGPQNDADVMRLAMQAGASDYLTSPVVQEDLLAALERLSARLQERGDKHGDLITVVNTRGGSGASFVAANLAYAFQHSQSARSVLIDFDLQFGGLSRYFDVNPKHGIIEALEAVDDMDETSAETYITTHGSGLRLLAACTDSLHLGHEVSVERVDALLHLFLRNNDFAIVDLPRRIDLVGATVLESSNHIVLVVQQSLSHIHDALRMIRLIVNELGVPRERLMIVLNRYDKKLLIDIDDIAKALKTDQIVTVPNHFNIVAESIDAGKPVLQSAKNAAVAKAITNLRCQIQGVETETGSLGILERAFPALLRRGQ